MNFILNEQYGQTSVYNAVGQVLIELRALRRVKFLVFLNLTVDHCEKDHFDKFVRMSSVLESFLPP